MMMQPYSYQQPLVYGDAPQDHHRVNLTGNVTSRELLINTMTETDRRADSSNIVDVKNLFKNV